MKVSQDDINKLIEMYKVIETKANEFINRLNNGSYFVGITINEYGVDIMFEKSKCSACRCDDGAMDVPFNQIFEMDE